MARVRSDLVQVVLVAACAAAGNAALARARYALELPLTGVGVFHAWVAELLVFVAVAATGWRWFQWRRRPFAVVLLTAAAAVPALLVPASVYGVEHPTFTFVPAGVHAGIVLLVGGLIARGRPGYFGDVDSGSSVEEGERGRGAAHGHTADAPPNTASTTESAASSPPRREFPATAPSALDVKYDAFDIRTRIGSGGTADVHLATVDLPTGPLEVALKTPRVAGNHTVDTEFFEQFREEAETWDRLDDHENVVTVYDWGDTPHPWIALEYMEAGDLNAWRDDLDLDGKLAALTDVAEAVHHAHTHGVNHTDLKPGNVLFTEPTGDGVPPWVAKVGDWGLANVLLEHSQSVEGFTLDYAAPEQVDPEQYGRTDHQTDVYQLGVVAYELLTGELPFDRAHQAATINAILNEAPEPPSEVDPDLPSELDEVLLQALATEKGDRQDAVVYLRDAFREL